MSVTKKGDIFHYDFWLNRVRYQGSTGETSKAKALAHEKRVRAQIAADVKADKALGGDTLTIDQACGRYLAEVGQFRGDEDAQKTLVRNHDWLIAHFGADTKLHDIDDNRVARMVLKRRSEPVTVRRKVKGKIVAVDAGKGRVSDTTVNRTATEPLRAVMVRARDVWAVAIGRVKWGNHLFKEGERNREAEVTEERAIMATLERGYDVAVRWALRMGARQMEVLNLEWDRDVNFQNKTLILRGKGGKNRTLPMPSDIELLLKTECWRHHQKKVFTYAAKRNMTMKDKRILIAGQHYPLTKEGLKTAFRRAVPKSGVTNFRFHDLRHTAASRLVRHGKSLRVAQDFLGHADPKTTTKYAHVLIADMMTAMDTVPLTDLTIVEVPADEKVPAIVPAMNGKKAASD